MLPKKRKNAQILLKSQESAQQCWKCKKCRKSAERLMGSWFCFCCCCFCFLFFSKSTVPPVKRTIVHFHDNSQATRWNYSNYDNRITRPTENVSKTKNCIKHVKNCKKKCLNVAQKAKKCSNFAQKSRKCSIVLEM